MADRVLYCIDTSVFIFLKAYPRRHFETIWELLEQLVSEGRLIAPDEVLLELEGATHEPAIWARSHPEIFQPVTQRTVSLVREIERDVPKLIDDRKEAADADAFIVALARSINEAPPNLFENELCIVVTLEKPGKGQKIPDACAHYDIEWIDWFGLLDRESK